MSDRQPHGGSNLSQAASIAALPPDAAVPPGFEAPWDPAVGETRWTPLGLQALVARLGQGATELRAASDEAILAAWNATVERFRDPGSLERKALADRLARNTALSPRGLDAALETVLAGVADEPAARLFARAHALGGPSQSPAPTLVVLAGNLPALGLQPLLPALARRRPLLLKSATAEPHFLPAFVRTLAARLPALGEAIAVACWRGGERALEEPVLAAVGRVLAYGDASTLEDLAHRAADKLVGYGPKASIAFVGDDADLPRAAIGLARDIALFDQRGCLSVRAIYTTANATRLAAALARELARLGGELPPGESPLALRAAVRQVREDAAMRGLFVPDLAAAAGTVLVEPRLGFAPAPGMRTVRIHPVPTLESAIPALTRARGRLQGAALAGESAWARRADLAALGLSRFAHTGELQAVDADWANGGIDPLAAFD